jgi:hypothetical protein
MTDGTLSEIVQGMPDVGGVVGDEGPEPVDGGPVGTIGAGLCVIANVVPARTTVAVRCVVVLAVAISCTIAVPVPLLGVIVIQDALLELVHVQSLRV